MLLLSISLKLCNIEALSLKPELWQYMKSLAIFTTGVCKVLRVLLLTLEILHPIFHSSPPSHLAWDFPVHQLGAD